tara:strand:+ start:114 stop:551 length:438 start_codon:yes stop_codon:yes gene_type:complete
MPTMLHDKEQILYLPDGEPNDNPYWKEIMSIALITKDMTIYNDNIFVFEQENKQIAAIQMPDPVSEYGTPIEEVLVPLRAILSEEDVTEIVESVYSLKENIGVLKEDPVGVLAEELDLEDDFDVQEKKTIDETTRRMIESNPDGE